MIEVENIIYEYPGKRALKDVSFKINEGSVTALVGPNGAGKTTLMRCIAALEEPFSGNIKVDGIDALEHPREVHKKIGYLSDFFGIYGDLTVRQCLTFIASIHQIAPSETEKKVKKAAKNLDLSSYLDVEAGTLSRGLRQRLGIAQAIIHEPKVLLLDEPASGLDPEARISLSTLFKDLQKQGMTLLVSSHILSELEDYCSEMLLLREGKIINHDGNESLENEAQTSKVIMTLLEDADKYIKKISKLDNVSKVECNGKTIECIFTGDEKGLNSLLKSTIENKIPLYDFFTQKKRLQDIYMDYAHGGKKNDSK